MQRSSHKWVWGKILQKLKRVWEKIRESSVYVYVCVWWATPATKKESRNIAPATEKKPKYCAQPPS